MVIDMLGFTKQEQGIVLFLIFTLLIGTVVTLYQRFIVKQTIPVANEISIEEFKERAKEIAVDEDNHYVELDRSIASLRNSALNGHDNYTVDSQNIDFSKTGVVPAANNDKAKKFLININKANEEELQNLPRIGPVLAERIVTYRQKKGGFHSLEELREVKGIGKATLKKIEPYITLR
ncbi:MAG: ComEA family DNA-binding protein [bacterium]